ncbi:pentatricopeptide repeat-containing protein At1g77360, mitochondrial [Cicer arietinum]|uniref:Pentatricopeptide repeat-containing protein At1g77360, mitochondrial n=1 Tax=Cicer arietinum TaxID=3827 RepID=A0A1S2YBU3_CICAR|nr:pentatricopeptide repeat-containing protein At1g77360, mitochondrial [Cicer arietinum]XP_004502526.1 pentatricopeptide repeat-containing protein At1g77360, mitochondrial [Cicer arietinum]XP_012571892.1 pentatricopeptide repeat-containing protein At1g77360, mitochondrial [Cicer arietinum]
MIKISDHRKNLLLKCVSFAKTLSTSEPIHDIADVTETLYKVMMSNPAVTLDTALNQTGVRVSPELVEIVLKRFENAGMSAFRFFEWAEKQRNYSHSVKAYHLMIESLAKIRQYQIMWDLVNSMRKKGMVNVETFCIIMRKYARAHKVDEAVYTFNVMDKYDTPQNLAAFNGLLSALCKSRNVRKAQEIFDSMKGRFEPDSKTYSILLAGWGKEPNLPKAREVFGEMVCAGCNPDIVTYGIMVDILCKAGRVDEAVEVLKDMDANNCRPTTFIYSVLVHTYGVENRIEDAIDTFMEMERNGVEADVVVYNALISAFCKANKIKNVHRVLKEMEKKGIAPNSRTCNVIMTSLITQGETDKAFIVFRRMIKLCEPDADTYTMLIKMFCERNETEMALKIWRYMKSKQFVPSLHTFSALINGLCAKGNVVKACILLEEMIEKGIRPSRITFGKLRQLLIKEGREDVLKFLHEKINILVKEPFYD